MFHYRQHIRIPIRGFPGSQLNSTFGFSSCRRLAGSQYTYRVHMFAHHIAADERWPQHDINLGKSSSASGVVAGVSHQPASQPQQPASQLASQSRDSSRAVVRSLSEMEGAARAQKRRLP